MKKLILLSLFFIPGILQADLWDRTESKEFVIWYSTDSPAAFAQTTTYMLIDKSDTVNFPHTDNKWIHITALDIEVDKVAATTATVRVGVISLISTQSATVTWFGGLKNTLNVSNTEAKIHDVYPGRGLDLSVQSSTTPYLFSNEQDVADTDFQTDQTIFTIQGLSVFPELGDVLIELGKDSAQTIFGVRVKYYTD